ncbi:DGQHR domain-containing protein [Paenibacillus hunanensis]|uniref:DNA sulfur modification protein DndB n=1 Tax=Paenibacillus hunanensis TaxID=539262 RepID=UPI00202766AA|nr:DNA sulfur modification protein DndB [Paenibacillus hunanensis]MCL9662069.1 DGQHR domain-containing protein [Paenibacillus hunanensis]
MLDLSQLSRDRRGNQIVLNAVGGKQFNQEVISVQCTVNDVLKFLEIDKYVQRDIEDKRVVEIGKYIQYGLDGNDIYFSPLIFSARKKGEFVEKENKFYLSMRDKLVILDGQHRIKAFESIKNRLENLIEKNSNDDLESKYDRLINFPLTIQVFLDLNTAKEKQLFTDVNTKSSVVNNTLMVMYKNDDLYGEIVKSIVTNHPTISAEYFETRSKTTRTKIATAATIYIIATTLNDGVIQRKMKVSINKENYTAFKKNTELFLTMLRKYAPKDALDRDKYVIYSANVLVAIAKFVYVMQKKYPNVTIEELFKKSVALIDWSHKNNDFRKLATKFNNQTKKYNFGSIGRIVRTFSEHLINKYELERKK